MRHRNLTRDEIIELHTQYLCRAGKGRASVGALTFSARAMAWTLAERGEAGMTITELAKATGCSVHAASRAAQALIKTGSIQYVPSSGDRRAHRVAITSVGRESVREAASYYAKLFREHGVVKLVAEK